MRTVRNLNRLIPAVLLVAIATLLCSVPIRAQWLDRLMNPKLDVPVSHAPGLGLQINRVAFGGATGAGAPEFVDALTTRFVGANLEVMERERLGALLQEHDFNLSGFVDKDSAAKLGKIVGPAVMLFVTGTRYTTEKTRVHQDWKDKKGPHRTYISRTQAFVRISVRSVDLATGRIFAAKVLNADPVFENKVIDRCCAEHPEEFAALDSALASVVEEAARLFVPWQSIESVYYFDDKDCNLKTAYGLLKAGDGSGALASSIRNVDTCQALPKPNPKALAHAYHNVGMSHFLAARYGPALEYLSKAQQTRPANIHVEAMAAVNLASREAAQLQRIEERMTVEAEQVTRERTAAAETAAATKLTNAQVVALAKAGLPKSVIISKIKTSGCAFETSTPALIALKKSAVPDDVIVAMTECSK